MRLKRHISKLLVILAILLGSVPRPASADATEAAIDAVLAEAHARGCKAPTELLDRILCSGEIKVGVRYDYPGFGVLSNDVFHGYEPDLAKAIADRLGVKPVFTGVNASNRIELVSHGEVDIVIATMSHSITRQRLINFVRPHYYASHTSVMGPKGLHLARGSIAGRTVCVPLGNVSNTALARLGGRLMIFDQPQHLLDALRFGQCSLVAHDDSYFAADMAKPEYYTRFDEKMAVLPTPWGIGIAQSNTAALEHVLSLIITDFHRSGELIKLAQQNHIADKFLIEQQAVWTNPKCILANGDPAPACMMEPVQDFDEPTAFAPTVVAGETWLHDDLGIQAVFPMLTGRRAWSLFREGLINTVILVFGAIAATVGFAVLFQYGLRQRRRVIRFPVQWLVTLLQSSPIVLLLILGYFLATAMLDYSPAVALSTAIIVIGLSNGSFAGAAMAEAALTLTTASPHGPPLLAVLRRSSTQVTSFAVNAARASAVASFIGTPELLTALTDIASVSTERQTTYSILLVIYLLLVMIVVGLAHLLTRWAGREGAVT
jgi:polar amino acid transport system substrate-binding protein